MYRISVVSVSDRASRGEYEDRSGAVLVNFLKDQGFEPDYALVSDDPTEIEAALRRLRESSDLILTSGGTGFSPRDNTPTVTKSLCDELVPSIPQAILYHSLTITPRAMLSRAAAGFFGKTLIVNLPGSPKAVAEIMDYIFESLLHGLDIVHGRGDH